MNNKIAYLILGVITLGAVGVSVWAWQKPGAIQEEPERPIDVQDSEKDSKLQIKVYFLPKQSPSQDCSNVSEVTKTVPYTQAVATTAINELLRGPQGSYKAITETAIPAGTKLLNLYIENGTAYAEFSKEIQNYGGDSCGAGAIRAQIENTLMQFPTVDRVEISVPGVVYPLQP